MKANFVRIMNLYGLLLKMCWKLYIVLPQTDNSYEPTQPECKQRLSYTKLKLRV